MDWKTHCYRVGSHSDSLDDLPTEPDKLDALIAASRKRIEPWLSAVFQAEHLNVILGSGFTAAIGHMAGAVITGMVKVKFGTKHDAHIDAHAEAGAKVMKRSPANIEDQFRSALALLEGLAVIDNAEAAILKTAVDTQISAFLASLLRTESGIVVGKDKTSRPKGSGGTSVLLVEFCKSRRVSRTIARFYHQL
jgi:hypothetical protein